MRNWREIGKMESSDTSSLFVPNAEEDSVDIYDGLDVGVGSNAEDASPVSSQLKESMDLYEALVTEEQQSRELSYIELQSRFQAAQNQIKELHRRLEQMEMQNTGLSSENHCLKKNISALLRTARQELKRKDAEIQRLNQCADRSLHHQSHTNRFRDPDSSCQTSTISCPSMAPPLPRSSTPHPVPTSPLPSRENHPHRDLPQPTRKEGCSLARSSKESLHSHSKRESEAVDKQTESDKHKSRDREEKSKSQRSSESTSRRPRDCSDPSKDSRVSGKNRSHREDKEFGRIYDSGSCKSRSYRSVEEHQRPEGAKTSSPEILHSVASSDKKKDCSREWRQDKVKMASSDYDGGVAHSSKEGRGRDYRKIKNSHSYDSRSNSKDRKKSSSSQHAVRHSALTKEKDQMKSDRQKDNQRMVDKRHEGGIGKKHRSSTQPGNHRESEKQRLKDSEKRDVDLWNEEKTPKAGKRSSEEQSLDDKVHCDENSPNRKLCFMETLNLTISPIKKLVLPLDGSLNELTPGIDVENRPDEKSSQPDMEDLFVIDEVNNSELEAQMGDAAEQSTDDVKASSSEGIHMGFHDGKDAQEKVKSQTGEPSVQTTSNHSHHTDAAGIQMTMHLTPRYPEAASLKVIDYTKRHEDNTSLVSNSQVSACGTSEVTASTGPSNISEQHTSTELQKTQPGNETDLSASIPENAVPDSNETSVELQKIQPGNETDLSASIPENAVPDSNETSMELQKIQPGNETDLSASIPENAVPASNETSAELQKIQPGNETDLSASIPENAVPASNETSAELQKIQPGNETDLSASIPENAVPDSNETSMELQKIQPGNETDLSASIPENAVPASNETSAELQKIQPGNETDLSASIPENAVPDSNETALPQRISRHSISEIAVSSSLKETVVSEDITEKASPRTQQTLPICQQEPSAPSSTSFTPVSIFQPEKDCCDEPETPKDIDTVSSTIILDSLPQEGLSLTEAIYVLTQTNVDTDDSSTITAQPSSSTGCIGVSKVSSTTEEKTYSILTVPSKKSFSPGKSQEPSNSVPLLHDEDSMMRTLSSLRRIPDAISPLRSPVRITKRGLLLHSKPGHVKSLQKDFSNTAADASSKKLDVNKENKYPGSPVNRDAQHPMDKGLDIPSSLSDTELEEGEILSESDEAPSSSPATATKRAKLAQPVLNNPSPSSVSRRKAEERRAASIETSETAGVSTQSPRSRFKTVCPSASKASFSSIEEVMDTFKLVRAEIRKKYMKLHKTFPKKSFYGVMDNFQKSFLEFVDGAHFGQVCSQADELKSKLKKLISSVFNKVLNNGIVKRIFEQQAVDLKQKLWDFVDVQVDYLFKDIHTTMKSLCKPTRAQAEDKMSCGDEKESQQPSAKKARCKYKEPPTSPCGLNQTKSCAVVPYRTGLGSRGKDIRITHAKKDRMTHFHPPNHQNTQTVVEFLPHKNLPPTPEKRKISSLVVSQNGSVLDKTDFELLTEQQASSLTFNLVRDSQMGEIFKCLLQGSDLLENTGITADSTAWSFGTPRKDGERFISITTPSKFDSPSKLLSPTKFDTPSKLVTTWSSISPRKTLSPRSKDQVPLTPALFDESCLLEVPSENLASRKSYSILAEDLAVSLTIPSPLKSDSHLSFLQPPCMSMQLMSTPDSVISAHISEDALLDGEDATEQDIHLALDTDNSSCGSISSVASETPPTSFVYKPDVPMQALVMERSNDHFILKIRQANTDADVTLMANESLSCTLTEEDQQHKDSDVAAQESRAGQSKRDGSPCAALPSENSLSLHGTSTPINDPFNRKYVSTRQNASKDCWFSNKSSKDVHKAASSNDRLNNCPPNSPHYTADDRASPDRTKESPSKALPFESKKRIRPSKTAVSAICPLLPTENTGINVSESDRDGVDMSESERSLTIAEDTSSSPDKVQRDCDKGRKRKKHQDRLKVKRSREEEEGIPESPSKMDDESKSSAAALSLSSLSAKNVVRKKGEVVMAWTRDEDRAILIELKTKGASRETFSALSEKLNKPSGQIAHRFYQLMKLFKRQEKMDT
ncbi:CASP8-associated protein 2 [Leuresthes tenuis]|uniref:CASP8-associated protein 2 n=1 Tax=Leuresthes tenuis TaxID=355514 RepID=UPI003B50546A